MRIVSLYLCLALAACAAAPKQTPPPGAQWITGTSAFNATFARNNLDNKVAAACPNGHEILDERSAIGWTAEVSKLVRCR